MRRAALMLAVLAAGCGRSAVVTPDAGPPPADAAAPPVDAPLAGDAAPGFFADFVAQGCERVEVWTSDGGADHGESASGYVCVGHAPLTLTFAPLTSPDVESYVWDFGDVPGAPPAEEATPTHTFVLPGSYDVRLTVGGPAGTAAVHHDPAFVQVLANPVGGACDRELASPGQCEPGLTCSCPTDAADDAACPPALGRGLCGAPCSAAADCGPDQTCADLSVSAAWRQPLCLPACDDAGGCPAGLACRRLPAADPAAGWEAACFPAYLGDIGAPCLDASGAPRPEACAGGLCLAELGQSGYCSAECRERPCPAGAACVRLGGATGPAVCLATCTADPCVADPLLACEEPGPGSLGFAVIDSPPPAGPFCAPRRCTGGADCAGLSCVELGGAGFCQAGP
ncbi:MAG TPA: PKD domain-containing protein [Polyangia bacterium]|jgi:hypothetical protein